MWEQLLIEKDRFYNDSYQIVSFLSFITGFL